MNEIKTIDCRGLACPAPVISVKKALAEQAGVRVLLDDGAPRENVSRFARNRGYMVSEEAEGNGWAVSITPGTTTGGAATETPPSGDARVVLITSDLIGDGPAELGSLLMRNFIHTLLETSDIPGSMFFMNRGVMLTCEGSEVIEALQKLAGMGVEILSCGLCLDFFELKAKLRVGGTTNMLTTADTLLTAPAVIKL